MQISSEKRIWVLVSHGLYCFESSDGTLKDTQMGTFDVGCKRRKRRSLVNYQPL